MSGADALPDADAGRDDEVPMRAVYPQPPAGQRVEMIPAGKEGRLRSRLRQAPSHRGPHRPCPKKSNTQVTPPRSTWPTRTAIE